MDAADDFVFDGEALALFVRLDREDDVAVLAAAAGLLDQLAFAAGRAGDGFAVGDLRRAGVGLHLELAAEAVDDDLQVQFTHAGNDGLAGFLVGLDHEGRVLFGEPAEGEREFFLVELGLRFDGHRNDRFREGGRLEHHVVIVGGERVAGGDVLEADHRGDVAGVTGVDVLVLVRLDLDQAADAFGAAGARVVDRVAFFDDAGIDAEKDQFADIFVRPEFEGEGDELFVVGGDDLDWGLLVVGIHADGRRDVERAGQVVDHGIQQVLDAFVLEGGPPATGTSLLVMVARRMPCLSSSGVIGLLMDELVGDFVIDVGHRVNEFVVGLLGDVDEFAFEFPNSVGGTQRVVVGEIDRLLVDHVDLADEEVFRADRDEDAARRWRRAFPSPR